MGEAEKRYKLFVLNSNDRCELPKIAVSSGHAGAYRDSRGIMRDPCKGF